MRVSVEALGGTLTPPAALGASEPRWFTNTKVPRAAANTARVTARARRGGAPPGGVTGWGSGGGPGGGAPRRCDYGVGAWVGVIGFGICESKPEFVAVTYGKVDR